MSYNTTIIQQLLSFIPKSDFNKQVDLCNRDKYIKNFKSWDQFLCMLYAQASGRNSLRDIATGLLSQQKSWYHLNLNSISKSNLAHCNNNRSYELYQSIFYLLLSNLKDYCPKHKFKFKNPLYSLDSSLVDLCLSVFPWAKFRKTKGALKIHCLLDHRGTIPSFTVITDGKTSDITIAREISTTFSKDSIITFDRAYIDYEWLYRLDYNNITFVTRSKKSTAYKVIGQHKIVKSKNVIADDIIEFNDKNKYRKQLRMVTVFDEEKNKVLRFITNNFKLSASTIASIYKDRWKIELFFKWIKQNLKIKSFLGTSPNAVMTQIWVALIYYLLLAYIKYQTKYKNSLLYFTRVIKENLFRNINMINLLNLSLGMIKQQQTQTWQLNLF
jgi:hypothetical protein